MRGQDVRKMSKDSHSIPGTNMVEKEPAHVHCGTVGVGYMCVHAHIHTRRKKSLRTKQTTTWYGHG